MSKLYLKNNLVFNNIVCTFVYVKQTTTTMNLIFKKKPVFIIIELIYGSINSVTSFYNEEESKDFFKKMCKLSNEGLTDKKLNTLLKKKVYTDGELTIFYSKSTPKNNY
jgi:hypothetical protein